MLFHIDKTSIKYIVYYLLCIQSLYKIDQIDQEVSDYKINDEYKIAIFCDTEKSENEKYNDMSANISSNNTSYA